MDTEQVVDSSPIGKFQILIWLLGTSVIFIDGFNIQVMGYLLPQLIKLWHIPPDLRGPIVSSGLAGVFVGYLVLSPFANRIGHRRMMIWCTLLIGIFTLATTLSTDAYSMMGLRFLTGIALGASNPSAVLIISDFAPKRVRSTFVTAGILGVSLGSMVAGLVAVAVLDRFGWKGVLFVGGLGPVLLTFILAILVPNTFDYVLNRKHDQAAALKLARRANPNGNYPEGTQFYTGAKSRSASVLELFRSTRLIGTLGIWISFSANLLVFFFIQSWLAQIIVQLGHPQKIAVTATSVLVFGGVCSFLAIGPLMDRFTPYKVLSGYFLAGGAVVALLGYLLAGSLPIIFAAAFLVGFVVLGLQKGMNAVCVYYYPTALRATGLGWGLGIGRLGAVIGPTLAGILIQAKLPVASLFYWAAVPMLVACVAQIIMAMIYGRYGAGAEGIDKANARA
ncbi:MAG TPA: MFS transporter [Stellaceae bacterium]|jgi:AAHS family 4-hydroxybenzoate transporter-like MFS transporter|nr:MFS transporter [Stellaceae bacterium]